MTSEAMIFGDVPMTVTAMGRYLQTHFGKPLALRKHGDATYKCPYCQKNHQSKPGVGHYSVACQDESKFNGVGVTIGERFFTAGYGVKIVEYKDEDGINKLIVNKYINY